MFHKKRDHSSLKVKLSTFTFTRSCFVLKQCINLSDLLSLMCPRLWPIENICIGLYLLKRLLNVWHILEKVMPMQKSFQKNKEELI